MAIEFQDYQLVWIGKTIKTRYHIPQNELHRKTNKDLISTKPVDFQSNLRFCLQRW